MATPTSNSFSKCAGKIYACMCFNGGGGVGGFYLKFELQC
jgi:hypothetical protein